MNAVLGQAVVSWSHRRVPPAPVVAPSTFGCGENAAEGAYRNHWCWRHPTCGHHTAKAHPGRRGRAVAVSPLRPGPAQAVSARRCAPILAVRGRKSGPRPFLGAETASVGHRRAHRPGPAPAQPRQARLLHQPPPHHHGTVSDVDRQTCLSCPDTSQSASKPGLFPQARLMAASRRRPCGRRTGFVSIFDRSR